MTSTDTSGDDGSEILDALAAEFVLGTLDVGERDAIARRRVSEPALEAAILAWEARLAPLSETVPDIAPPADLLARIARRLDSVAPIQVSAAVPSPGSAANDNVETLMRRAGRWRNAAFATGALAAALLVTLALRETTRSIQPQNQSQSFVAVLQQTPDAPAYVINVDLASRQLTARPVSVSALPGKSYQLWLIAGGQPRSLGLLGADGAPVSAQLGDDAATIQKATYAVTLEPAGGSTQPTTTPVLTGMLQAVR